MDKALIKILVDSFFILKEEHKTRSLTVEEIQRLEELYVIAKHQYYIGDEIMPDPMFDELENILKLYNSNIVEMVEGDDALEERFKHFTPALSLEKLQILDEDFKCEATLKVLHNLSNFFNRNKFTNRVYEAGGKYDGTSMSLQYIDGILTKGLTRGDDTKGGGLDKIDKMLKLVPNTIDIMGHVEIRGEMVIDKKLWERKYSDPNKADNPRNFVSGKMGTPDLEDSILYDLVFVAYQIICDTNTTPFHHENTMGELYRQGFNEKHAPLISTFSSIEEFEKIYLRFKQYREKECPFQLDGIVIKYEEEVRMDIGITSHHPKWAMAIKFPPEQVVTTIIGIEWAVGTTGQLTPVAILEPVELDGTLVKRASLHNYGRLIRSGSSIGARVVIAKKGDIIPQVIEVLVEGDGELAIPANCECGGDLEIVDGKGEDVQHLICTNDDCKIQAIGKLEKAIKVLKIANVGEANAEKFYNAGVKTIANVFNPKKFNKKALIDSKEYKEGRALDKVMNGVYNVKTIKINDAINALNFDGAGKTMSREVGKLISGVDSCFDSLEHAVVEKMTNPTSNERLIIQTFIGQLELGGIKIEYFEPEVITADTKIMEMTGSPKPYFKSKSEFVKFAAEHNIKVGKLNKDCDYLLTDSYSSSSSKMAKADKLDNVEIITYADLLTKLS